MQDAIRKKELAALESGAISCTMPRQASAPSAGADWGADLPGSPDLLNPVFQGAPEPLAKFVVRVPDSSDDAPESGGLPFAMAMRRLPLAFATARPAARPSGRMVVDWAILPMKRTKSATKRISDPVEMRDTRGALHSFLSDIVDLCPCRPRADGTYINTDNRISLASGRALSKATLFWVLHLGGWIAFGTFVWALNIADIGPFPSAVE